VVAESWTPAGDRLELEVEGLANASYALDVWNPSQLSSVDGATLERSSALEGKLRIHIASSNLDSYVRQKIALHFVSRAVPEQHKSAPH
jgi:hypothetical protein